MTDLYLKFTDEPQANSVLYTEVPTAWDDEGEPTEWEPKPNYANIDTIGVIYEGGEWDDEGNVITEPAALSGWHVNVRLVNGENIEALEPFAVQPKTLLRVWG
jgi:hypothetical protein